MERTRRKPVSAMRCVECEKLGDDTSYWEADLTWEAPVGIDPRMRRFVCPREHECFKVLAEKSEQNLVEFLEENKTL